MYLAGLIAEPKLMHSHQLQKWVEGAYWYMISEYTVAFVTAESNHGLKLAIKWIESENEQIASAGWASLSHLLKLAKLYNIKLCNNLLNRIINNIHKMPNRVKYTMNGFVIATGVYLPLLTAKAMEAGNKIGKVNVNMGETSCKVPEINSYIKKTLDRINKRKK